MNNGRTRVISPQAASPLNHDSAAYNVAYFPRNVRLDDGSLLRLRELRPRDRERLKSFFARCTPQAIRYRFHSPIKSVSGSLLDYLANSDGSRHVALIVTRRAEHQEMILGEARYVVLNDRPAVADVAVLIADELQRRGIATLLFRELMEIACRNGVSHFNADVQADNRAMIALLRKISNSLSASVSTGVIHFEVPIQCRDVPRMLEVA